MDKWTAVSLALGLSALVLAIPLGIISTLIAPRVQRWWAKTTLARTTARLKILHERMEMRKQFDADYFWLITYLATPFINGMFGILCQIAFAMLTLLAADYGERVVTAYILAVLSQVFSVVAKVPLVAHVPPTFSEGSMFRLVGTLGFCLSSVYSQLSFIRVTNRISQFVVVNLTAEIDELEGRSPVDNFAPKSETPIKPLSSQE